MSRQSLVKIKGFLVATEYFYAATELPEIVSPQSTSYIKTESSRTRGIPCRNIVFHVTTMGHGAASLQGGTHA